MSYETRTGAVLFARNLDRISAFYAAMLDLDETNRDDDHILLESPGFQLVVHRLVGPGASAAADDGAAARRAQAAFKPVFFVPSLSRLRGVAGEHGGALEPAGSEWSFRGATVCDAIDPEGNVIQFREHAIPRRSSASA